MRLCASHAHVTKPPVKPPSYMEKGQFDKIERPQYAENYDRIVSAIGGIRDRQSYEHTGRLIRSGDGCRHILNHSGTYVAVANAIWKVCCAKRFRA
jgi:hypothetical protein